MNKTMMNPSISRVEKWTVPPADQGQIVEVAYGADYEGGVVWKRIRDRSDGLTIYEYAPSYAVRIYEPWNTAPVIHGSWRAGPEVPGSR